LIAKVGWKPTGTIAGIDKIFRINPTGTIAGIDKIFSRIYPTLAVRRGFKPPPGCRAIAC
ncbi:MAG: hypothetical protein ACRC8Y_13665, partial [Chroococcales cyanobacterium]